MRERVRESVRACVREKEPACLRVRACVCDFYARLNMSAGEKSVRLIGETHFAKLLSTGNNSDRAI